MRRFGIPGVFLWAVCVLTASPASAAKIVAVEGDVAVREGAAGPGAAAAVGQEVTASSVIETASGARCTLAFDEPRRRLAVVKENSSVTLESLGPEEIFLAKGRVFSLIKAGASGTEFRVKTPTAVAGARGTAWETGFEEGRTSVSCLENIVYVMGISGSGETTEPLDLLPGSGVMIGADGVLGDVFDLSQEQLAQFREDRQPLDDLGPAGAETSSTDETLKIASSEMMPGAGSGGGGGSDPTAMTDPWTPAAGTEPESWSDSNDLIGDDFDMVSSTGDPVSGGGGDTSLQDLKDQAKDQTHEQKVYDEQTSSGGGGTGTVVTSGT